MAGAIRGGRGAAKIAETNERFRSEPETALGSLRSQPLVARQSGIAEWRHHAEQQRRFGERTTPSPRFAGSFERFREIGNSSVSFPQLLYRPFADFFKNTFIAWSKGNHGAPLLMGLGFLLGSGAAPRIREEGGARHIRFAAGEGPIRFGRKPSEDAEELGLPDILLEGHPQISRDQAELFRLRNELYLRDLVSRNGSWVWRNRHWQRVDPTRPEPLGIGDIFALGHRPSSTTISDAARRPSGVHGEVFRVGFGSDADSFRIISIAAPSLEFFLFDLLTVQSIPVFANLGSISRQPEKSFQEKLRLTFSFGLGEVSIRIRIADRLMKMGHYLAAEQEFKTAEAALAEQWSKALSKRPIKDARQGKDPKALQVVHSVSEAVVLKITGDFYLAKGFLLELSQRPADAAAAYAYAADVLRPLLGQSASYERAAHQAYRLYFSVGEAALASEKYILAADGFEQAARFAEAAQAFVKRPAPIRRSRPWDPMQLLEQAAVCLFRAGPHFAEEMARVQRKIEGLTGEVEGPFR